MKNTLLTLTFTTLIMMSCTANAPDSKSSDYYWYDNTKIYLERGNQQYIIYEEDLLSESDKKQIVESGDVYYSGRNNLKWGKTAPDAIIEDIDHVLYLAPSFKREDGGNMFVTHRFYVRLNNINDFPILQKMIKKYGAEIEKPDDKSKICYTLQCGLPSSYSALELANIFYESGLFASTEPEFIGAVYLD